MKYYYFYKTTNLVNNKYYYGVHITENLNDKYLGSGKILKRAFRKYGKDKFKQEPLVYFDNKKDMFDFERLIVDEKEVKNLESYNVSLGGKGGHHFIEGTKEYDNWKSALMKGISTEECRIKNSKATIKWMKENPIEHKKNIERLHKAHKEWVKNNPEEVKEANKKVSKGLKKYWNTGDVKKKKEILGKSVSTSEKFREAVKNKTMGKSGYDNADFVARWKDIYESVRDEVLDLVLHTNLPDAIISKRLAGVFGVKIKIWRLYAYYQHKGWLGKEIGEEFPLFFSIQKMKKRIFEGYSLERNYTFYNKEWLEDYNNRIKNQLESLSYTDSMLYNSDIPYIKGKLYYYEHIGLIKNTGEVIKRPLKELFPDNKTLGNRTGQKTIYEFNKEPSMLLIEKEKLFERKEITVKRSIY